MLADGGAAAAAVESLGRTHFESGVETDAWGVSSVVAVEATIGIARGD